MNIKIMNKTWTSYISYLTEKNKADNRFLTGYTDAEGCFCISTIKNSKFKAGWKVLPFFEKHVHKKDTELLRYFQKQLGGIGNIIPKGKNTSSFRVNSLKELSSIIIPYFEKYPLITQKYADFFYERK